MLLNRVPMLVLISISGEAAMLELKETIFGDVRQP